MGKIQTREKVVLVAERLLTPREVAERLAVTEGAIRAWIRVGKLKGIKVGRLWRIREQDLEEFLKKGGEKK